MSNIMAAICIYNSVTRPGDSDSCFLHPEPLDDRKKITTVIQKLNPSRKSVLSKPRSDSVVPKASKPRIPIAAAKPVSETKHVAFELNTKGDVQIERSTAILEKCLDISKADAKKILDNKKSAGKFHLYIVPLDEGSRAMLFAYKKANKHYVLSIAQKGTAGTSAWINMERAGRADPEESAMVRKIQSHSITVPDICYPTPKTRELLLTTVKRLTST